MGKMFSCQIYIMLSFQFEDLEHIRDSFQTHTHTQRADIINIKYHNQTSGRIADIINQLTMYSFEATNSTVPLHSSGLSSASLRLPSGPRLQW